MTPLRLTPVQRPAPSWIETCCRWLPIVGWTIANELEKRRLSYGLESLAQQLASRSTRESHSNTYDYVRSQLTAFVARTVKDLFGWPNDHFFSDDPFDLMVFGDDGEGIELIDAIEVYLDLPKGTISDEQMESLYKLTFGQVIDFLLELPSSRKISQQ